MTRQQTQQFASQQELRARTDINQIVAARERQQAIQQQQQQIEAQTKQIEEQRKQVEEQARINSPEFQQSAYKDALRIIQSGYGVQGLPSNNDAFSQAVRTYFYKIQKNPELYQQTRMGDTAFKSYAKANPELFFPYQPAQQQAPAPEITSVTITPESRVSELLKQGLTSGQIFSAGQAFAAQRKAIDEFAAGKISVAEAMKTGLTSQQITEIGKQISTQRQGIAATESFMNAPKVDVSTPFSRTLLKLDKAMGFQQNPPQYEQLAQQYKGSPLGLIYSGAAGISKGTQLFFQKIGISEGESKFIGESAATTSLFGIFSPLFSTMATKKGTKQVVVEKKPKAEIKKEIPTEQAQKVILQNSPSANRELIRNIIQRAITENKPEAISQYQKLFEMTLGKERASQLFSDIASQEGLIPAGIRVYQPRPIIKPTIETSAETFRPEAVTYPAYLASLPSIVGGQGKQPSQYSGKGIYEISIPLLKTEQFSRQIQPQQTTQFQKFGLLGVQENLSAQISPSISIQPTIQPSAQPTIQLPRLEQPLALKSQQQLKTQTQQEFGMQANLQAEQIGKLRFDIFGELSSKRKGIKKSKAGRLGYFTLVKRRGRFMQLGGLRPKGKALALGERIARETLARTFKVVPSKRLISASDITYRPSAMFRGYQIRKGARIALPDTYIQRARFSLSSGGERREIQSFKRAKTGGIKWL